MHFASGLCALNWKFSAGTSLGRRIRSPDAVNRCCYHGEHPPFFKSFLSELAVCIWSIYSYAGFVPIRYNAYKRTGVTHQGIRLKYMSSTLRISCHCYESGFIGTGVPDGVGAKRHDYRQAQLAPERAGNPSLAFITLLYIPKHYKAIHV